MDLQRCHQPADDRLHVAVHDGVLERLLRRAESQPDPQTALSGCERAAREYVDIMLHGVMARPDES